jgi:hypothetical protein
LKRFFKEDKVTPSRREGLRSGVSFIRQAVETKMAQFRREIAKSVALTKPRGFNVILLVN